MKKKIIVSGLNPKFGGGITNLTRSFLKYFSKQYKIEIYYPYTKKETKKFSVEKVKEYEFIKFPKMPREWQSFFLAFKKFNFNIYQAIGGTSFESLPFYLKKVPYFLWTATTLQSEKSSINIKITKRQLDLEKKLYLKAVKIFTISNATKKEIIKITNRDDIILLPPPINPKFLSMEKTEKKERTILFVGRLNDPRKNVDFLLNIFEKLKLKNVKLILVSPFPPHKELLERIKKMENNVVMKIGEKDIKKYYSQASLFFLPSKQEGFGIVVAEAMAMGLPVISTKCGGPEDIIEHSNNGYLIEQGDLDSAVKYVDSLLTDSKLNEKMGIAGKNFVMDHLLSKKLFPIMQKEYELFLKGFKKNI